MGLYVKKDASTWVPATSIYVKTSTSLWQIVKKIYVKTAAGVWNEFWPKVGPFADMSPFLSSSSSGLTALSSSNYQYLGSMPYPSYPVNTNMGYGGTNTYTPTTIYGYMGDWNPNTYSISNFSWQLATSSNTTGAASVPISGAQAGTMTTASSIYFTGDVAGTSYPAMTLNINYDKSYLVLNIVANTSTSGIAGADSSDSPVVSRVYAVKYPPVAIGGSYSITATGESIGSILTFSSTWQSQDAYLIESSLYLQEWKQGEHG